MAIEIEDLGAKAMCRLIHWGNQKLDKVPPLMIAAYTITAIFAISQLSKCFQPGWGLSKREMLANWLLKIPSIRQQYNAKLYKQYVDFCAKVRTSWTEYGQPILEIPEDGWKEETVVAMLNRWNRIVLKKVQEKQFSGTIYSKSLIGGPVEPSAIPVSQNVDMSNPDQAVQSLNRVFTLVFKYAKLWNQLHDGQFGIGYFIDYCVIRMTAKILGGDFERVKGVHTSGGTESLMFAARMYRNLGMQLRGHQPGQSVIIAPNSIHAAIWKAEISNCIQLVLIDYTEDGELNWEQLEAQLKYHGSDVVAIFASGPRYDIGKADDVVKLSKYAAEFNLGLHIDCCIGGFVINEVNPVFATLLQNPAVTSVSVDNHKFGQAPKGSSVVLITEFLDRHANTFVEKKLESFAIYSFPKWTAPYGTIRDAGSTSCVPALLSLTAMLLLGKKGYKPLAEKIFSTAKDLANFIRANKDLKLLGEPDADIVAFNIHPNSPLSKGAIYALAHIMQEEGIVLDHMHSGVHFCITPRFVGTEGAVEKFKHVLTTSMIKVHQLNEKIKGSKEQFPGEAGLYCSLDAALTPTDKDPDFYENIFFGEKGAKDAIRLYFMARMDPYGPLRMKDVNDH